MDTKRMLLTFIALCMLPGCIIDALSQKYYTEDGDVVFISESTMESFNGSSSNLVGLINLQDSVVDFYVDLNTLDTGIKLRNEHMRENFLHTEEHRFASFYGTLSTPLDPALKDTQQVKTTGTFTVNGNENNIEVTGKAIFDENGVLHLTAGWELNLNDYNIEVPKLLFLKVSEEQIIEINAILKPQN